VCPSGSVAQGRGESSDLRQILENFGKQEDVQDFTGRHLDNPRPDTRGDLLDPFQPNLYVDILRRGGPSPAFTFSSHSMKSMLPEVASSSSFDRTSTS